MIVVVLILLATSLAVADEASRIIGGSPIHIDQVPWQVALEKAGEFFCGGSVISKNYVLTSAYCVQGLSASDISVRCGTSVLQTNGTVVKVDLITSHDSYNAETLDYDVAILKLASPLPLSKSCSYVKLSAIEPLAGTSSHVTGWGTLSENSNSPATYLQEAILPVVDRNTCKTARGGGITNNMICAGTQGRDACSKDFGGPLTVNNVQAGIVSLREGCDRVGFRVYTNIAALQAFISTYSNNEAQFQ